MLAYNCLLLTATCCLGTPLLSPLRAQERTSLEAGGGFCVSLNHAEGNRLPPKMRATQTAGAAFSLGVVHRFSPRWAGSLAVKTASLHRGLRIDHLIYQRDAQGGVNSTNSSRSLLASSPAHFTAGARYYFNPAQKLKISAEGGGGYMMVRTAFASSVISGVYSNSSGALPEEEINYVFDELSPHRANYLVYASGQAEWRLTDRSGLALAVQYHHGFRETYVLESRKLEYINRRTNTSEQYETRLVNRGRYPAARLLYCFYL
ncbi:hypothetical protein [Hymenobacter koreensis]|uniref:Outer membrane protein beta-barrel domain-containing protein n=1 Tax=Hymenobacter koreensis TaxID=1084523 RepID=A0ABP8IU49_9BACT